MKAAFIVLIALILGSECIASEATKPARGKKVELEFDGQVIEQVGGNRALQDSLRLTGIRRKEATQQLFKKRTEFRAEIEESIREVGDLQ